MTDTEKAALCARNDELCAEVERLKGENATLRRRVSELEERIASLGGLVSDSLAVILGWAWKLNEIAGYDRNDQDTYPMETFTRLLYRAKELEVVA